MSSSFAHRSFNHSLRRMNVIAAASSMLSTAVNGRAEALSPVNPGASAKKIGATGVTIAVRGGHGGGGGRGGGHAYSGSVRTGSFSAGPAISTGGARVGNFAASHGVVAHHFHHGFRHRHGFFVGGVHYDYPYGYDYPYVDYPAVIAVPGCRIVPTIYGPCPVCHTRAARHHRHDRHHHHRRHHRA